MTTPAQVLSTLADLAPDTKADRGLFVPSSDVKILPFDVVHSFAQGKLPSSDDPQATVARRTERRIRPLLRRARLHDDDRLRIGWLWVAGLDPDGDRVFFPLVSAAVRHRTIDRVLAFGWYRLREPEVTDLIPDPADRDRLEASMQYGGGAAVGGPDDYMDPKLLARLPRLHAWASEAAAAAGFPTSRLVARPSADGPAEPGQYEVRAHIAAYLASTRRRSATIAATLRAWPGDGLTDTAFAAGYGLEADPPPGPSQDRESDDRLRGERVRSPLVLSPTQRDALLAARTDRVTVISGPPGTGKSHTIAAIALDEVARGRSVLVAAPTEAAVDALTDLLTEVPGPDPLVFGSSDRRDAAADRLGQGGGAIVDDDTLERTEAAAAAADAVVAELRAAIMDLLTAEQLAGDADPATVLAARRVAPRWFADADLAEAERLLASAARTTGWFARLRKPGRIRRLVDHAGASSQHHDPAALERALDIARARRHVAELERSGGLELTRSWAKLTEVEDGQRRRHGEWLNALAHSERRVGRDARVTMAAVAAALRAGRLARRKRLAELDGRRLTTSLPLWVGTLRDIDDLLPPTAAMFDVVIVDEASQVDQIMAAPALLRARRAVVVGDPKQLRHVSFLAEQAILDAVDANDIVDVGLRAMLDVRRMSLFDVAAARVPTRFLDEHFRSAPHLIGFSARRFYDGALSIATTHPANHDRDCISVRWIDGRRGADGVNEAEVDAVIQLIRERQRDVRHAGTTRRIGVVAPFRAQADALEARIVSEFELAEIDELGLRVGTVHGFQGCERDLVILSPAVDTTSTGSQRAFMNDRNLFNVMVTRAREELVVVTSLGRDTPGLIGDYLRYGDSPPPEPPSSDVDHALARAIAGDLRAQGVAVHTGYRSGRHVVDLVLGSGEDATGLCFGVHPHGPEAHVERHLALVRAGWTLREIYDSAWNDRAAELAVELVVDARPGT